MAVARLRLDSFNNMQLIKRASSPVKANTRIAAAKITSARVNPVRDRPPLGGRLWPPGISNGAGPLLFNTLRKLSLLFMVNNYTLNTPFRQGFSNKRGKACASPLWLTAQNNNRDAKFCVSAYPAFYEQAAEVNTAPVAI